MIHRLDASPIQRAWNGSKELRNMAPDKLPPEDIERIRMLYRTSYDEGPNNTLTKRMIIAATPGAGTRGLILLGAIAAPHVLLLARWIPEGETNGFGTFIGGLSITARCFWPEQGDQSVGMQLFTKNDSEHRFIKKVSKRVRMGLGFALWNQKQLDIATERLRQLDPRLR